MAIYTPRGLKLRLPIDMAFALMARLHPRVDAFRVLKTTEAYESVSPLVTFLTFLVGIACFALRLDSIVIAVTVVIVALLAQALDRLGWVFVAPFIVPARIYSYVSGFGLLLATILVFGYWRTGWRGLAGFFAGRIVGSFINYVADFVWAKRVHERFGLVLTASERHFFHAYCWHASRTGASLNFGVSDEERDPKHWQHVLLLLHCQWPQVTRRFTEEMPAG